jgi:prepilin-type N-terminal cleavage/methylation domain-containing protein
MFFCPNKNQKGFTLIELLVVISIIGLLSTVVLGSLNSARAKSRDAKRLQDLVQMRTALELYAQDHGGQYPLNIDDGAESTALGTSIGCSGYSTGDTVANGLVPTYISKIPEDPKPSGANCYVYMSSGVDYKFLILQTVESIGGTPPKTINHSLKDSKTTNTIRDKSLSVYTRNQSSYDSGMDPVDW